MIKIEKTMIKGRYNLIDTLKSGNEKYIRQMSLAKVQTLAKTIIDLIE